MAAIDDRAGRPSVKLSFRTLARRGHQRCLCNEEGFGTLSRQLGNDLNYRSSRADVSGCFTRQHIHRLIKQGKFPPPVKLGENTNAWPEDEIDAYLKACIAKRDAAAVA